MIVAAWLVVVTAGYSVLHSLPAAAHTGFTGSEPADGDELAEPVGEVVITFSGEAEPTGEGFVALDPVRGVRAPDEVLALSESEWLLRFDPPLAGGEVAVRWTIKASDAHAISGGFSFTVIAEAQPDQPDPVPDTTPDATDESASEPPADEVSESATVPNGDTGNGEATAVVEAQEASSEPARPDPVGAAAGDTLVSAVVDPIDAADFAAAGTERLEQAELVANVGRGLGYAGAVLAIGALIFAVFVLDRADEIVAVARWAGTCGLIVVCGAALEVIAQVYIENGRWSVSYLWAIANTEPVYSAGLRAMGGALLWALPMPRFKLRNEVELRPAARAASRPAGQAVKVSMPNSEPASPSALSTKPALPDTAATLPVAPDPPAVAWRWGPAAAVAIVASVMLATAHIFDGHTLSKGNRVLISLAAVSHVVAAAAWAGGVVALVLTLWRRRHRPPVRGAELGARFSVIAAVGLVVVGVAGVALTAMIVDTPSQLWTTQWGRLLLAKVALVVAGAALGGYNHYVLIPGMAAQAEPGDDEPTSKRAAIPAVLAVEAGLLVVVAVLAGVVVGAAL